MMELELRLAEHLRDYFAEHGIKNGSQRAKLIRASCDFAMQAQSVEEEVNLRSASDLVYTVFPLSGKLQSEEDFVTAANSVIWEHCDNIDDKAIKQSIDGRFQGNLEEATKNYLSQNLRVPEFDYLLIDAVIANEMLMYGTHAFSKYSAFPYGKEKSSPLSRFFTDTLGALFVCFLLSALVMAVEYSIFLFAGYYNFVSDAGRKDYLRAIVLGGALAASFWFIYSELDVIKGISKISAEKRNALTPLAAMAKVYVNLVGNGPFSSKYIRELAVNATNEGVCWSGPLFALLDDVSARSGSFWGVQY